MGAISGITKSTCSQSANVYLSRGAIIWVAMDAYKIYQQLANGLDIGKILMLRRRSDYDLSGHSTYWMRDCWKLIYTTTTTLFCYLEIHIEAPYCGYSAIDSEVKFQ